MKKLLLTLLFCLITLPVSSKVIIYGANMEDLHVDTIKGHLYETSRIAKESGRKDRSDLFARSVTWLEKLHKSKKTFDISNINKEEAKVIKASVYFISRVEAGDFIPQLMPATIGIWIEIGRIIVVDKSKSSWKLKTKKKRHKKRK
jgi:hypothetical protein